MQLKKASTVLITGSSSGLGKHLAYAFARKGWSLILHGRDAERLDRVQQEIKEQSPVFCQTVQADLVDPAACAALIAQVKSMDLQALVNNAAINPELTGSVTAGDYFHIQSVMNTNVTAAIALSLAVLPQFTRVQSGTIININSVAGLRGSAHEPLYAASKFALRGFSESVKEDWLKQGTRIFDIYCGALATGMSSHRADLQDLIDPQELSEYIVGLCRTRSFFAKEVSIRRTRV